MECRVAELHPMPAFLDLYLTVEGLTLASDHKIDAILILVVFTVVSCVFPEGFGPISGRGIIHIKFMLLEFFVH
jgi:hypothetical protein